MQIRIVKLNPSEPHVAGKYQRDDHVIALCNCTNAGFISNVPDAKSARGVTLTYKKTDASANTVTLNPSIAGQKIDEYV